MRKAQKKQAKDFVRLLEQVHDEIKNAAGKENAAAMELLEQCQEGAIELGNLIEKTEGEGFVTISLLEDYCEQIYQLHEEIRQDPKLDINKACKYLNKQLMQIKDSINSDVKVRIEVAFLPYKASMWDSLESIWMAADEDPNCDAYVIPIPYYDKNEDESFREMHYEGTKYPEYVPVTWYKDYDFEKRKPDIIFIHNPYDGDNFVTSIDPRFFSGKLKKYTECLVYVPYYVSNVGLGGNQEICPVYINADYIVVQAEKSCKLISPEIPREKILPLGSPKLDRVIRLCDNPPEPPEEWNDRLRGKRVFFYNTSISDMLSDTEQFLKKMAYVFQCFQGRDDICLIWRPHPLLESTFTSMRQWLKPEYDRLKKYYIDNGIGIYDDTPDVDRVIALSDAYIGNPGSSVVPLFGVAGKQLFILNKYIDAKPEPDDWMGQTIKPYLHAVDRYGEWMVTLDDKLYHSPKHNYQYEYYCDLSERSFEGDYLGAVREIAGKVYVCPSNAQDILVIGAGGIERRICLEPYVEKQGAFSEAWSVGRFLFLIPNYYPAIVRYDTKEDKIDYIKEYNGFFVNYAEGERRVGGSCIWNNCLLLASPIENCVLAMEGESGQVQILKVETKKISGYMNMIPDGDNIWLLPFVGRAVACWNPYTGKVQEYSDFPRSFVCINPDFGHQCEDKPFGTVAFYKDYIYLAPYWGNMFLRIDRRNGTTQEWVPPFTVLKRGKNGYFFSKEMGYFIARTDTLGEWTYRFFSLYDCRLYDVNLETEEYAEIAIKIAPEELREHEPGFDIIAKWLPYGCRENYFNDLEKFLDDRIEGKSFDRNLQIAEYGAIAANSDGTSGEKIYNFVKEKLLQDSM